MSTRIDVCGGRESRSRLIDIGDSSFRDYLDLFKFRSSEAEEFRHLDDLIRTYKIRGLSAESIYTWGKLVALHCLRDVQTKAADTFR